MRNPSQPLLRHLAPIAVAGCLALPSGAWAQGTGDARLRVSGFLSVVGEQFLDGSPQPHYDDLSASDISLTSVSRNGVQFNYALTDRIQLLAHTVVHSDRATPNPIWARAGYKLGSGWAVQLEHQRTPLNYAIAMDQGQSSWINLPSQPYAWDTASYSGASLLYNVKFGATQVAANLFAGREDIDRSPYWKAYSPDSFKVNWKNILGAGLELTHGPFTVRGLYMKADAGTDGNLAALTAYGIPAAFRRTSASLRYDVDSSSGIKMQLDRNQDLTNNLNGAVTVFRVSYDRVF